MTDIYGFYKVFSKPHTCSCSITLSNPRNDESHLIGFWYQVSTSPFLSSLPFLVPRNHYCTSFIHGLNWYSSASLWYKFYKSLPFLLIIHVPWTCHSPRFLNPHLKKGSQGYWGTSKYWHSSHPKRSFTLLWNHRKVLEPIPTILSRLPSFSLQNVLLFLSLL